MKKKKKQSQHTQIKLTAQTFLLRWQDLGLVILPCSVHASPPLPLRGRTKAISNARLTPQHGNLSTWCRTTARETAADTFTMSETRSSPSGWQYGAALKNEQIRIKTEDGAVIWHPVVSRIIFWRGLRSNVLGEWHLYSGDLQLGCCLIPSLQKPSSATAVTQNPICVACFR